MENVAAGETVGCLEILGRDDLHAFDEAGEIRRVGSESSDYSCAQLATAEIPIPFFKFIGSELYAGGEDVLAFAGEFGVEDRGNGDVEIRSFGKLAVFGGVKGALEIIDFRADVDAAGESFEKTLGGKERREQDGLWRQCHSNGNS